MRTYARLIRAAIAGVDAPLERLAAAVIVSARLPELHDKAGLDRGLSQLRLQLGQAAPDLLARSQQPVTDLYRELVAGAFEGSVVARRDQRRRRGVPADVGAHRVRPVLDARQRPRRSSCPTRSTCPASASRGSGSPDRGSGTRTCRAACTSTDRTAGPSSGAWRRRPDSERDRVVDPGRARRGHRRGAGPRHDRVDVGPADLRRGAGPHPPTRRLPGGDGHRRGAASSRARALGVRPEPGRHPAVELPRLPRDDDRRLPRPGRAVQRQPPLQRGRGGRAARARSAPTRSCTTAGSRRCSPRPTSTARC